MGGKFLAGLLLLTGLLSHGVKAAEPDWTLYGELLSEYVSPQQSKGISLAWVDYSGLAKDPRYEEVLQQLRGYSLARLETEAERKSFYINAYNILAIDMVVRHWPLASIKDVGSWLSPVWDKPAGQLGGETVSLGFIEHEVLRPMGDPRIHMAIVCASLSCPDLLVEPYDADSLERQLDQQTHRFLGNQAKGLVKTAGEARISKIFDWFEEDFDEAGGVIPWIESYMGRSVPKRIRYLPYHWQVNGS